MNKTILDLNAEEMRKFFLDGDVYFTTKLPKYFEFHSLLSRLYDHICGMDIDSQEIDLILDKASQVEKVNYKLIINKDGHYAWRKLEIIHPLLYVILVRTLEENWHEIQNRFVYFKKETNDKIICASIPTQKFKPKQKSESYTKTTILNWWERVEQQSLKLALEYSYLINTDITDCYGSLYTHSIPWAIMEKEKAKQHRTDPCLGNKIDKIIRSMQYGQTNGIPAGSVLMDFIAEIVLGYIDTILVEKIKDDTSKKMDYKIIRYRDDYKIFVHNPKDGENILKNLSEVLMDFGFKLNPQKTSIENSVINGGIKKDKLDLILSPFVHQQALSNQLIFIYNFGRKHVNSGQMIKLLSRYRKKLKKLGTKNQNNNEELEKLEDLIEVLISISVNIAYETPKAYPVCFEIISELIDKYGLIDKKTREEKAKKVLKKIKNKFADKINNDYMEIWMQRLSIKLAPEMEYRCQLCNIASGKGDVAIWESSWLSKIKQGGTKLIEEQEIKLTVDQDFIKEMSPVISPSEVEDFSPY